MPELREQPDLPELLTAEDVAQICRVSLRSVRRWIACGSLPVSRLGRSVRIHPSDLRAFLTRPDGVTAMTTVTCRDDAPR